MKNPDNSGSFNTNIQKILLTYNDTLMPMAWIPSKLVVAR